jgi:ribosomal protein L12E/L44/L45/RPP1/RPP2
LLALKGLDIDAELANAVALSATASAGSAASAKPEEEERREEGRRISSRFKCSIWLIAFY